MFFSVLSAHLWSPSFSGLQCWSILCSYIMIPQHNVDMFKILLDICYRNSGFISTEKVQVGASPCILKSFQWSHTVHSNTYLQEPIGSMNMLHGIWIEEKASRRTKCILRDTLSFWIGQCFARVKCMSASEQLRLIA